MLSPIAYALQRGILLRRENPYWARVAAATRGFESYALQRGILLHRENPTYWYWAPIEAATRGFDAKKLTKVKIFQKVLGELLFGNTLTMADG